MGRTFFYEWEIALMEWLQSFANPVLVKIASIITLCGEQMVLVGVFGFFYWCYDKELAKKTAVGLLAALVWNPGIKNIFLRRRPYFDNPSIACLKPVNSEGGIMDITSQGYSFPSGHSTNSVTAFTALGINIGKKWSVIIGIIIPLFVGISRFFLGVHYPTDVFFGWMLGAFIIFLANFLQEKIENKAILYGLFVLTAIPGFFFCKSNDYYTGVGLMIGIFGAFLFEERYVNFEGTKNVIRCILRLAGAFIIYMGLNELLKVPFPDEFLKSATTGQFLVRTLRYAVVSFTAIGVYPMLFKVTAKIGRKA